MKTEELINTMLSQQKRSREEQQQQSSNEDTDGESKVAQRDRDRALGRFMIAGEAPILLSKACEFLIKDISLRSWCHTLRSRRRTLQRQDVLSAVGECDTYDFLIDILPRTVVSQSTQGTSNDSGSVLTTSMVDGTENEEQNPNGSSTSNNRSTANNAPQIPKRTIIASASPAAANTTTSNLSVDQNASDMMLRQHIHNVYVGAQMNGMSNPGNASVTDLGIYNPFGFTSGQSSSLIGIGEPTQSVHNNTGMMNLPSDQMRHMQQLQEMIQQQTRMQNEAGNRYFGSTAGSDQSQTQHSSSQIMGGTSNALKPVNYNGASKHQSQTQMTSMNYSLLNYDKYLPPDSGNSTNDSVLNGTNSRNAFPSTVTAMPAPPVIAGQQNAFSLQSQQETLRNESFLSASKNNIDNVNWKVMQRDNDAQASNNNQNHGTSMSNTID